MAIFSENILARQRARDVSKNENNALLALCARMARLPSTVCWIICEYAAEWQLLPWIDKSRINWTHLSKNTHPGAIELLLANLDNVEWLNVGTNPSFWPHLRDMTSYPPSAYVYLHTNPDWMAYAYTNPNPDAFASAINVCIEMGISKAAISTNPAAVAWLEVHPTFIDWEGLSANPAAERLLMSNQDKIHDRMLCSNPAPFAVALAASRPNCYPWIARTPAGLELLIARGHDVLAYDHRDVWPHVLSINPSPQAIEMAITRPALIDWSEFSKHSAAIRHLARNTHLLSWKTLFENPAIFYARVPVRLPEALLRAL